MDRERTFYEELQELQDAWQKIALLLAYAVVQAALIPVRFVLWLNAED